MKTNLTSILLLILFVIVSAGLIACSGGDQDQGEAAKPAHTDTAAKPADMMPAAGTVAETERNLEICRAATKKLGSALKPVLQAAMNNGGPVNAMSVCHDEAGLIAQQICQEEGLVIGRTSQKFRNPSNAPDKWEMAGLETFEGRIADGAEPQDLELWGTVVNADGGRLFRYLKAIPTAPVCLGCHGSDLAPEVVAKLDELYPGDQARGFVVGEMRGVFTVQLELD